MRSALNNHHFCEPIMIMKETKHKKKERIK